MRTAIAVTIVAVTFGGCTGKPSAMAVCQKLEKTGVATNCRPDTPGGLGAAAKERAEFDLPSVPGKGGSILTFETEPYFDNTVNAYAKMASIAGPHRYGSRKALVFVQMNDGASNEVGQKTRTLIESL